MDRRTKTLAIVFGAIVVLGAGHRLVWPSWIEPLLSIGDRVAERQEYLDGLLDDQETVTRGIADYRAFAGRVGTFEVNSVQTQVLDRLGSLIEKHKLEDVNVTPGRPKTDSKTGLKRALVTVKAVGTLRSGIEFLRDVSELPQLVRIGNAAFSPASRSRKAKGKPRMNIRVPIEVLVIPQRKIVGRINDASLEQPQSVVRHQDRNYSLLWELEPFSQYVPPKPLRAAAGRDVNAKPDQKGVSLTGSASGGEGELILRWEPTDFLSDPNVAKPTIDTAAEFERTYTLTATDESGKTSKDTVKVVVKKPPERKVAKKPEPPPPPPPPVDTGPKRWKDRKYMQLRMTLLCSAEAERTDELAIYNNRIKATDYYTVGDEFDGGELVHVHPTGAIVRRRDQYFVYPIGAFLDEDVATDEAGERLGLDYPQLARAVDWFKQKDEANKEEAQKQEEAASDGDSTETAPKPAETEADSGTANTAPEEPGSEKKGVAKPGKKAKPVRGAGKNKPQKRDPSEPTLALPDDLMKRLLKENGKLPVESESEEPKKDKKESTGEKP